MNIYDRAAKNKKEIRWRSDNSCFVVIGSFWKGINHGDTEGTEKAEEHQSALIFANEEMRNRNFSSSKET